MNIVLASAEMVNDINNNFETLKKYVMRHKNVDLIVFGEVFLHGFDALTWDYEQDKDIAFSTNDDLITEIRALANQYNIAISFGFFERDKEYIYTTNLFIDKNGEILDCYRRVSKTWKSNLACERYKSGDDFQPFEFMGKTMLIAICGDLWFDEYIKRINEFKLDYILWPLYIDYSKQEWEGEALKEYNQQVSQLNAPVIMVNSYMKYFPGAIGGAYLFDDGKIKESLPLGEIGSLLIHLK